MDEERPLKEEVVDMETLVDDVALDTRAQDPERLIEVTKDIKIEALVLGDEMRLRQVLSNLTRNAITHTPKGSPIYLSLKTKDTSVVIVVKDEGPGLTLEQQEHIFDRFYRVDKSRTRALGGAGLGLSIVSSLVKAHNGTIEVDSIEGEGATFTLTLPLLTLEQDEEES
jgi:two-component system OmpR family sensor kinase